MTLPITKKQAIVKAAAAARAFALTLVPLEDIATAPHERMVIYETVENVFELESVLLELADSYDE